MNTLSHQAAALATAFIATFGASESNAKSAKVSKTPTEATTKFNQCNEERLKVVNAPIRKLRMEIIAATHPEYFTFYTVKLGDTWSDIYKKFDKVVGPHNDVIAEINGIGINEQPQKLVPGMKIILPSKKAIDSFWMQNAMAAVLHNEGGSRYVPCDVQWNYGKYTSAERFDDEATKCLANQTKENLKHCVAKIELATEEFDTEVLTCSEATGGVKKCQQTIRRDCQRAMTTCAAQLEKDKSAAIALRTLHSIITK